MVIDGYRAWSGNFMICGRFAGAGLLLQKACSEAVALQCAYQNSLAGSPKGFAWKKVVPLNLMVIIIFPVKWLFRGVPWCTQVYPSVPIKVCKTIVNKLRICRIRCLHLLRPWLTLGKWGGTRQLQSTPKRSTNLNANQTRSNKNCIPLESLKAPSFAIFAFDRVWIVNLVECLGMSWSLSPLSGQLR
jgi:hypothetical protein